VSGTAALVAALGPSSALGALGKEHLSQNKKQRTQIMLDSAAWALMFAPRNNSKGALRDTPEEVAGRMAVTTLHLAKNRVVDKHGHGVGARR
jgi:hypothetical protein